MRPRVMCEREGGREGGRGGEGVARTAFAPARDAGGRTVCRDNSALAPRTSIAWRGLRAKEGPLARCKEGPRPARLTGHLCTCFVGLLQDPSAPKSFPRRAHRGGSRPVSPCDAFAAQGASGVGTVGVVGMLNVERVACWEGRAHRLAEINVPGAEAAPGDAREVPAGLRDVGYPVQEVSPRPRPPARCLSPPFLSLYLQARAEQVADRSHARYTYCPFASWQAPWPTKSKVKFSPADTPAGRRHARHASKAAPCDVRHYASHRTRRRRDAKRRARAARSGPCSRVACVLRV